MLVGLLRGAVGSASSKQSSCVPTAEFSSSLPAIVRHESAGCSDSKALPAICHESARFVATRPADRPARPSLEEELLRRTARRRIAADATIRDFRNSLSSSASCTAQHTAQCTHCQLWLSPRHLATHMGMHPSEIVPGLWLGAESNACSKEDVTHMRVTHVLNVAAQAACGFVSGPAPLLYLHLQLEDNDTQQVLHHFPEALDFIQQGLASGRVLVHCVQGISRSATFVVAYLMQTNSWTLKEALSFVRSKRSLVCPNRGFLQQLVAWERQLFGVPPGQESLRLVAWSQKDQK